MRRGGGAAFVTHLIPGKLVGVVAVAVQLRSATKTCEG